MAVRSAPMLPNTSQSEGSPPGLMPTMKRPSSMLSSIDTVAASWAGWPLGRLRVPVPSLICLVSCTRLARKVAQLVTDSATSVTCSPTNASQ